MKKTRQFTYTLQHWHLPPPPPHTAAGSSPATPQQVPGVALISTRRRWRGAWRTRWRRTWWLREPAWQAAAATTHSTRTGRCACRHARCEQCHTPAMAAKCIICAGAGGRDSRTMDWSGYHSQMCNLLLGFWINYGSCKLFNNKIMWRFCTFVALISISTTYKDTNILGYN
jgi:hypothetical protein